MVGAGVVGAGVGEVTVSGAGLRPPAAPLVEACPRRSSSFMSSAAAETPAPAIAATSRPAISAAPGRRFPEAEAEAADAGTEATGAVTGAVAGTSVGLGACGGAGGGTGTGAGTAGLATSCVGVYSGAAAAYARSSSSSSSRSASSAPSRSAGSRSSSPCTTGSSGPHAAGGRISSKTTACSTPPSESRRNGDAPLTAAQSRAPSDHRSDSGPTGVCADIRSGAVYSGDPTKAPVEVSVVAPATCAIPKSVRTGRPPGASSRTFAGLMSRCSTPAAWAVRRAPSRAIPIRAPSAGSTGPVRESRSAREPPSTSSMTMYGRSSSSTMSCTTMMCGCLS